MKIHTFEFLYGNTKRYDFIYIFLKDSYEIKNI
jgi:hypothetical protein